MNLSDAVRAIMVGMAKRRGRKPSEFRMPRVTIDALLDEARKQSRWNEDLARIERCSKNSQEVDEGVRS